MRITRIHAVQPHTPADPPGWRTALGQILVAVETAEGIRGIGVGGGGAAGIHVVEAVLQPLLTGERVDSIDDVCRLWERMYRETLAFGRKGLVVMAISGVDLALWDALGKAEGLSVARLLAGAPSGGAPRRTRLPCYATVHTLEAAEKAAGAGFRAVKLALGAAPEDEVQRRVEAARTRLGPDIRIAVDAWGHWDLARSLRAVDALAAHDLAWVEEPLPPDDLEGYAELTRRSSIPIAGGEHEYTIHGFRELAAHRAHTIWQPDVCWTGGLTQLREIYALGAEAGARVIPHRGAEVWSLHAIAALDPQPLAESGRPWITWLRGQPPIAGGEIEVPDRPGFGVEPAPGTLPS